ncbi:WYL domain-containing protein [Cohnella sp. REN36]|uniref:WYL domain-containing protein n=1 Tax=Cohnella sp. REN36 TaxID=2887347 RepID=UPI001D1337A5|nr:WYL domain-containing protein [Cohnella sp. REN36]MCC3373025.1 WYL domain-containing protein [Cohnella sp. REN36]
MPERYIGRTVEMIYLDRQGQITQRVIQVRQIRDGRVLGWDLDKRAPRSFDVDRILAVRAVPRRVS